MKLQRSQAEVYNITQEAFMSQVETVLNRKDELLKELEELQQRLAKAGVPIDATKRLCPTTLLRALKETKTRASADELQMNEEPVRSDEGMPPPSRSLAKKRKDKGKEKETETEQPRITTKKKRCSLCLLVAAVAQPS